MTFKIGWLKDIGERALKEKTPDTPEPKITQQRGKDGAVVAFISSESEPPIRRKDVEKDGSLRFPR